MHNYIQKLSEKGQEFDKNIADKQIADKIWIWRIKFVLDNKLWGKAETSAGRYVTTTTLLVQVSWLFFNQIHIISRDSVRFADIW